jgi:hypothetical protein
VKVCGHLISNEYASPVEFCVMSLTCDIFKVLVVKENPNKCTSSISFFSLVCSHLHVSVVI